MESDTILHFSRVCCWEILKGVIEALFKVINIKILCWKIAKMVFFFKEKNDIFNFLKN